MRPKKVHNEEMLTGLLSVLRAKGYDGASLNELATAAGLKKASLYHRFPGGKKEMATAVLQFVSEWSDKNVYQALLDKSLLPKERILKVIDNIRVLYDHGRETCILRAMSMDTGLTLFGQQIQENMEKWVEAFTQIGIELGFTEEKATEMALQSFIEIQGSLVVAKGMGQISIFESVLQGIYKRYQA